MSSLKVTVEKYTLRVCIFEVGRGLLAGCCIVYLNEGGGYCIFRGIKKEKK